MMELQDVMKITKISPNSDLFDATHCLNGTFLINYEHKIFFYKKNKTEFLLVEKFYK